MSADIINLRQARKARARLEKEEKAQENRLHFGRSKAEKRQTQANRDLDRAKWDAHRRETVDVDAQEDEKER